MLTGANQDLTSEQVIDALLNAIKGVLQRHSWAAAFAKNGFGPTFEVRAHLLEVLELHTPPVMHAELPSYAQFTHCFPARQHIPFMQLLCGVLPPTHREPRRARDETTVDDIVSGDVRTWKTRLRPRLLGRAVIAKAKSLPDTMPPASMPPMPSASSAGMAETFVPMMSSSGHPLPSVRRFPPSRRESKTGLL